MRNPTVCAVCITADRPVQTARAIRSFMAQTYKNKYLLIFDTSKKGAVVGESKLGPQVILVKADRKESDTIGSLRNLANGLCANADILCHWDSDDWSHPLRIAEQVADLDHCASSSATGYADMIFWDSVKQEAWHYHHYMPNYAVGTSLMYPRTTWVQKPFPELGKGEDSAWIKGLVVFGTGSHIRQPRMIAEVHGGNTSSRIVYDSEQFTRVPHRDQYCREHMNV